MDDSEIIKIILQGDKDKFRVIVEKHQQMVFMTCMGFVHNKDDADDLTQEVFLQAWRSLPRFKGNAAFSTWIYRIAVNASLNKLRKSLKHSILHRLNSIFISDKTSETVLLVPETENPENLLISEEQAKWVNRALDSLPENQKTAFVLSKYDDLPQKEIAVIMNITEGAVEALLHRARQNLRQRFSAGKKINRNSRRKK